MSHARAGPGGSGARNGDFSSSIARYDPDGRREWASDPRRTPRNDEYPRMYDDRSRSSRDFGEDERERKRSRFEVYEASSTDSRSDYYGYLPPGGPAPSQSTSLGITGNARSSVPLPYRPPSSSYDPRPPSGSCSYPSQSDRPNGDRENSRAPTQMNEPSSSVIFLNLPPYARKEDLFAWLQSMTDAVESTTVIIDPSTGLSKRFGFAKFSSIEHARAVVEANFDRGMLWDDSQVAGQPRGPDTIIRVNYSVRSGGYRQEQGAESRRSDERRLESDASQSGGAATALYVNDGTRDVGTTSTDTILLRRLDALTSEEEIWTALGELRIKSGETIRDLDGIVKIMIARERATRGSWGFAFVKLRNVGLANAVMANVMNPQLFPTGFRIRKTVVAFSFCHENSFVPIYAKSEWSFSGDSGQQLTYWDDKSYVTHWTPPPPSRNVGIVPRRTSPAASVSRNQDRSETAGAHAQGGMSRFRSQKEIESEADVEAFFSSLDAEHSSEHSATDPVTAQEDIAPAQEMIKRAREPEPRTAPSTRAANNDLPGTLTGKGSSMHSATRGTPNTLSSPWMKSMPLGADSHDRKEKRSSDTIQAKKMASHLDKWSQKQAELKSVEIHDAPPPSAPGMPPLATPLSLGPARRPESSLRSATTVQARLHSGDNGDDVTDPLQIHVQATSNAAPTMTPPSAPAVVVTAPPSLSPPTPAIEDDGLPYGDAITKICLLCSRQFKSLEEIHKHNRLSKLHLTNLSDQVLVTRAIALKAANLATRAAAVNREEQAPKYVDRAAARREHFYQPDRPERESRERKKFEGPPPREVLEQPNRDGIEESNVGSRMLEKMGWSKGAGLGATGAGRSDPVLASQFAQGAGLGSTRPLSTQSSQGRPFGESLRDTSREVTRRRYQE